jgi:hypothetical protein
VDLLVLGIGPAAYWALRQELEQALGRPLDLHTQDDDPVFVAKAIDRGKLIFGCRGLRRTADQPTADPIDT